MKKTLLYTGICFLMASVLSLWSGCGRREEVHSGCALFSWKASTVLEEPDRLIQVLEKQDISALYQELDSEMDPESLTAFLEKLTAYKIELYFLTGSPEWALERYKDRLLEKVEAAAGLKRAAPEAVKGIVLDVEPYLLEEWEDSSEAIMESYISSMRCAYHYAREQDLELILCIPYFYDTKGLSVQLEALIGSCCDSIAVMNYYRGMEMEHIAAEAALAKQYGKGLVNIYEMQPPDEKGLTEKNTYYNQGIEAARENFRALQKAYPGLRLSMALHEYQAVEEMTEDE